MTEDDDPWTYLDVLLAGREHVLAFEPLSIASFGGQITYFLLLPSSRKKKGSMLSSYCCTAAFVVHPLDG